MIGRIIPIVLACLVSLWSTLLLSNAHRQTPNWRAGEALATDGAYRDGLYVGRLTAQRGSPARPPAGRWSNPEDRQSFAAGYQRGYDEYQRHKATTILAIHNRKISRKDF